MPRAVPRAAVALLAFVASTASAFQLHAARSVLAPPTAARAVSPVGLFGQTASKSRPKSRAAKLKKVTPQKKVKRVTPQKKPKRVAPQKKLKRVTPQKKRGRTAQVAKVESQGLPIGVQAGLLLDQ